MARAPIRDKAPPHSVEAEQALIGGLLLDGSHFAELDVEETDFYRHDHRAAFRAISALVGARQPIDLVTVTAWLEDNNLLEQAGGVAYLGMLARDTPTASNIASYGEVVRRRANAKRAQELAQQLVSDPGSEEIDYTIRELMRLTARQRTDETTVGAVLADAIDLIDRRYRKIAPTGLTTGLIPLDNTLGGLSDGHLYVIAGRPGMGKSAFGVQIMLENQDIWTGMLSMEQPTREVVIRMIASVGNVNAHHLRLGVIGEEQWPRITDAAAILSKMKCVINDRSAPTIDEIVRQARKWKYERDIRLLVVDYLQRIPSEGKEKRHEQVERFARAHKEIARELSIPVVLLSQVNRELEHRQDKRPQMSDLRDSGAIEAEADAIITLYRDEVYYDDPKYQGQAEISVIKHRHGPLGRMRCAFNKALIRYEHEPPGGDYSAYGGA